MKVSDLLESRKLREAKYAGNAPDMYDVYDLYQKIYDKYTFNEKHGRPFMYGDNLDIVDVTAVESGLQAIQDYVALFILVTGDKADNASEFVKAWIKDIGLPYTDINVDLVNSRVAHVTVSYEQKNKNLDP